MLSQIRRGEAVARRFLAGEITALELEEALLAQGFHSVQFNPPSAIWEGVRYPLDTGLFAHFSPEELERIRESF